MNISISKLHSIFPVVDCSQRSRCCLSTNNLSQQEAMSDVCRGQRREYCQHRVLLIWVFWMWPISLLSLTPEFVTILRSQYVSVWIQSPYWGWLNWGDCPLIASRSSPPVSPHWGTAPSAWHCILLSTKTPRCRLVFCVEQLGQVSISDRSNVGGPEVLLYVARILSTGWLHAVIVFDETDLLKDRRPTLQWSSGCIAMPVWHTVHCHTT